MNVEGARVLPLTAVAITGHISAGKSTLLREVSDRHGWSIASFGEYVRSVAKERSAPVDRKSLQDIGHEMFRALGATAFLEAVIAHGGPLSEVRLFDGVRDIGIVAALRQAHARTVIVYLDVPDVVRYERHLTRMNLDRAVFTFRDFVQLEDHPIEQGTRELPGIADELVRVTRESVAIVVADIEQRLGRHGIL
jgi:dephospho-CoA kinase